jgi:hypothetical protein
MYLSFIIKGAIMTENIGYFCNNLSLYNSLHNNEKQICDLYRSVLPLYAIISCAFSLCAFIIY